MPRSRQDGINKLRQRVIVLGEALALIRQFQGLRKTQLQRYLDEARSGGWVQELEAELTTFRELHLERQSYGDTDSTLDAKMKGFEEERLLVVLTRRMTPAAFFHRPRESGAQLCRQRDHCSGCPLPRASR
jgi:hypothetical protein